MELGDRLKRLREEKGISQLELAKVLNLSNVMLSRYEKNKRSPDYETLSKLADYYGVTTDFLLGRTNIRTPQKYVSADPQVKYESLPVEIYEHIKVIVQYFMDEENKKRRE
jgi:transcriptional regulator with XRE-family HTH domain